MDHRGVYDSDARQIVLSYIFSHSRSPKSINEMAMKHEIAVATIYRWLNDFDQKGFIHVNNTTRDVSERYSTRNEHLDWLIDQLMTNPTMYYSEMCELVFRQFGYYYETVTCRYIHSKGLTHKSIEMHAKLQNHAHRAAFRHLLRSKAAGGQFTAQQLVFVDETHLSPAEIRRRKGYAYIGVAPFVLENNIQHGEVVSTSCIATLSIEGILTATPLSLVDGNAFVHTLENVILPCMAPFPLPKSVLILDNAAVHLKQYIGVICQSFGVLVLFLPAYSYDFNPIELCFHVAKSHLRKRFPLENANSPLPERLVEALFRSVDSNMACKLFQHCYIDITNDSMNNSNFMKLGQRTASQVQLHPNKLMNACMNKNNRKLKSHHKICFLARKLVEMRRKNRNSSQVIFCHHA